MTWSSGPLTCTTSPRSVQLQNASIRHPPLSLSSRSWSCLRLIYGPGRPTVPLTVHNSRAWNALAFSTAHPNYLAVGLDKVHGDPSLVLWPPRNPSSKFREIRSPRLKFRPMRCLFHALLSPNTTPMPAIATTRCRRSHICLAFILGTTHLLLAGISNKDFRFFDLRAPITRSESPQNTP